MSLCFQLQSRDLIADQVETAAGGHWLDGMVVIPGCDKNMPGTLMALGRLNRPGLMVYGGTIRPGQCGKDGPPLDIVSAFQAYGKYLQDGETPEAEKERVSIVNQHQSGPDGDTKQERVSSGCLPSSVALTCWPLRSLSRLTPSGTPAPELEPAEE